MEAIHIIPCLDIKDGRVVKGVRFVDLKDAGDPVAAAQAYAADGADEIAFLDITATIEKRKTTFAVLAEVAAAVPGVPVVVGGGLKTPADIEQALAAGAARVSLSSAAFRDPDFVAAAVRSFGGDRLIVAIDADASEACASGREVFIDGGRTPTGRDAVEFACAMRDLGVGALLPTSRMTDGVQTGYDLDLTRGIALATGLPVIASGGAGHLEHFAEAVTEGRAAALLAASVFHFGRFRIREVKDHLRARGIPVTA